MACRTPTSDRSIGVPYEAPGVINRFPGDAIPEMAVETDGDELKASSHGVIIRVSRSETELTQPVEM